MAKTIRIGMNRDLQVKTQNALLGLFASTNKNIDGLRGRIERTIEAQELFYETFMAHTARGRWKRFKKWIGGKK